MRAPRILVAAGCLALGAGCVLDRAPILRIVPTDGGPGIDAPGLDAPELDAPGLDAPELDAPAPDAPPLDAPLPPDAPDAPSVCTPAAETCNGRDDDCDGSFDESVVCRACSAPGTCNDCVRFEAGGRVYQSCPPVTGLVYWRRICATLGGGYDLAVPGDATENAAIAAELGTPSLGIAVVHWIGVNDFETNGAYVRVDGTPLGWAPRFATDPLSPRASEGAAAIEPDGDWDDYPLTVPLRMLCELDPTVRPCAGTTSTDSTCDGRDDDCDGFWDEDCTGGATCSARVFWNEVLYVCLDNMSFSEGREACRASGGDLAVLDDRFALEAASDFTTEDTWVGLEQSASGAEPDGGWAWVDGTAFPPSDPDWGAIWDTAQPSSMATEDCAFIKDSSGRLQDHDCASDRTRTLCAQPLQR